MDIKENIMHVKGMKKANATGVTKSAVGTVRKPVVKGSKATGMAKKKMGMSYKGVGVKGKGKGMVKRSARAK